MIPKEQKFQKETERVQRLQKDVCCLEIVLY